MRTRVDDYFFSKIYMMRRHMVGILLDCGLEVVRAAGASLDPADVGVPLNSFDRSVLFSFWRGISLGFGAGAKAHSDAKSKICQLIAFANQSEDGVGHFAAFFVKIALRLRIRRIFAENQRRINQVDQRAAASSKF
jgi:hypothetical protein